jgi:D-alanyl-lipoteichoic acid acyltransferase DltB (MBOAT superfamily)
MKLKLNWDALGIGTSVACAIHCAVLPIVLSSLPIFGVEIIHNKTFEWGMILLAFVVGVYALYHGFIEHHQSYIPIISFCIGIFFLVLKQLNHSFEIWCLPIAVVAIIFAHYYNYKLCKKVKCVSPHHKH